MFWYEGQLIQGNTIELAIYDPGLLYGATVFTTLRVYEQSLDHRLTHWKAHCDRLHHSLQAFGWQLPNWQRIRQGAEALLAEYPVLRIVIFADGREWISGRFLPENLGELQQQGVIGWVADEPLFQRSLGSHKTGNYLGAWLARQKAEKLGAKEAILVDQQGNWLETSTGNLWGWKEDCWWTPPLDGDILPGIVRSQLLNWLESQNLPIKQNKWDWNLIEELEVIAYTNSVMEVIPLATIMTPQGILNPNPHYSKLEQLYRYFKVFF